MTIDPQEVSRLLVADRRAAKFLSPSVAVAEIVGGAIRLLPGKQDKPYLARVISVGEQWVREAVRFDLLTSLLHSTSNAMEEAALKVANERLSAMERKIEFLQCRLYDSERSADFMDRLFIEDGEASKRFKNDMLTLNDLMDLEPAAYILAVCP